MDLNLMLTMNLINSEVTRRNYETKKTDELIRQMLLNQQFIMLMLADLGAGGFSRGSGEELNAHVNSKLKFDDELDRWVLA